MNRASKGPLIINTLLGGLVGAALGVSLGNPLIGLIVGALCGLGIAVAYERLARKWRRRQRLYRHRLVLLVLSEILLIVYVGVPIAAAYLGTHPIRFPVTLPPWQVSEKLEDVSFTTSDGVTLKGWYIPSRNGAVIIAIHGFNGNRSHVVFHAKALADHGYGVLLFDMRMHGESGGAIFSNWETERDVLAAKELVKRLAPRPMLFISGGLTEYETSLAQRYVASAGSSAEAWDLPGVDHVSGMLTRPEEYTQMMLSFFDQHLR